MARVLQRLVFCWIGGSNDSAVSGLCSGLLARQLCGWARGLVALGSAVARLLRWLVLCGGSGFAVAYGGSGLRCLGFAVARLGLE